MGDRDKPDNVAQQWPRPAVSAAIFRDGMVLLAERGKGPYVGVWSLPGGHVEPGETTQEGALREVAEETGIKVELIGHVGVHDVIARHEDGTLRAHYVLNVFVGRWLAGEPVAGSDCRTARFVAVEDVGKYELTSGCEAFIARARHLLDAAIGRGDRA